MKTSRKPAVIRRYDPDEDAMSEGLRLLLQPLKTKAAAGPSDRDDDTKEPFDDRAAKNKSTR